MGSLQVVGVVISDPVAIYFGSHSNGSVLATMEYDGVYIYIYTVPYYPTSKYPNAPHSPLAPKMDDKKTIQ